MNLIVFIIAGLIVALGIRTIVRDWRKHFAEGEKAARARHAARLEHNRKQARSPSVTTLEKGEDGVYRPKD